MFKMHVLIIFQYTNLMHRRHLLCTRSHHGNDSCLHIVCKLSTSSSDTEEKHVKDNTIFSVNIDSDLTQAEDRQ